MTMKDIEAIEEYLGAPGYVSLDVATARELVARAKAWERVMEADTVTATTQEFGDIAVRIIDDFKAAAAKGFRP